MTQSRFSMPAHPSARLDLPPVPGSFPIQRIWLPGPLHAAADQRNRVTHRSFEGRIMWKDFKAFLLKENVLALAIAVVLGAALGKVVTALVDDFIMPIVAVAVPGGSWRTMTIDAGPVRFLVGDFLGHLINFLIVGFVVWRISKAFIKPAATAPTQACPYCRMQVDKQA